jgi:hypothetical protein
MIALSGDVRELTKTYHERNKYIRRCWGMGFNTWQISRILGIRESYVERIVFDHVLGRKKKKALAA